jgi:salicylate hydroxylase
MRRAMIAGAGIGGLAAALALSQSGFAVTVFERAPALEPFGAGVQLTPNATRILARLGVLSEVAALAMAPRAIRVSRGADDAELSSMRLDAAERRWGAPYLVIHRADLQRVLARAVAQGADIRLGREVTGMRNVADGVTVSFSSSREETSELLIGADGLRSKVRESMGLGRSGGAVFSRRVAFRATMPTATAAAPEVTLRLGPSAHLVQYPLREGKLINLVAVIEAGWRGEPSEHPWDGAADRPALARAFAGWSPRARALIHNAESWRAWPLFHREPMSNYADGRVALVGDAAHAMVPFLAQGAAQAIEDAGTLADRLRGSSDIPAALASYSRARAPRAGRVQREALSQARIYHMSGPFALARDLAMRTLGAERLLARYDWLYGA